MEHDLHLSDRVEIVTDRFSTIGAPRGSIGVVVEVWSDGSNDVEISDPKTGAAVATVRATADEARLYAGVVKTPRKHGFLFGRGDEVAEDVEAPPMPPRGRGHVPGQTGPAQVAFSRPPEEDAELIGDIPWELRDEPPSEPVFH